MPIMSGTLSVAANTTSANVVAGETFEFAPGAAIITVLGTSSATGINCSLTVGGLSVAQGALVSHANRFPIQPDDVAAQIGADPGDRLFLTFTNTTGGALTVFWKVNVDVL